MFTSNPHWRKRCSTYGRLSAGLGRILCSHHKAWLGRKLGKNIRARHSSCVTASEGKSKIFLRGEPRRNLILPPLRPTNVHLASTPGLGYREDLLLACRTQEHHVLDPRRTRQEYSSSANFNNFATLANPSCIFEEQAQVLRRVGIVP